MMTVYAVTGLVTLWMWQPVIVWALKRNSRADR